MRLVAVTLLIAHHEMPPGFHQTLTILPFVWVNSYAIISSSQSMVPDDVLTKIKVRLRDPDEHSGYSTLIRLKAKHM